MAKTNKDAAFGLRAIGKVGQNRDNQGLGEYSISSGDTTQIFFQDAVSATAAGTIHQAAASEAFLLGSLNGVFYTDPTTTKPTFANNYPGSISASDIKAFVAEIRTKDLRFNRTKLLRTRRQMCSRISTSK